MKTRIQALLAASCLVFAAAAQAQARLQDKAQLVAALASSPPCCVVDGRSAASRQQDVMENALVYRADLKIVPSASVVVIADRDQDALGIARALARKHPGKAMLAVKGGLATWKAVTLSLLSRREGGAEGLMNFVIPANTCEQGKPLQTLRPDRK